MVEMALARKRPPQLVFPLLASEGKTGFSYPHNLKNCFVL